MCLRSTLQYLLTNIEKTNEITFMLDFLMQNCSSFILYFLDVWKLLFLTSKGDVCDANSILSHINKSFTCGAFYERNALARLLNIVLQNTLGLLTQHCFIYYMSFMFSTLRLVGSHVPSTCGFSHSCFIFFLQIFVNVRQPIFTCVLSVYQRALMINSGLFYCLTMPLSISNCSVVRPHKMHVCQYHFFTVMSMCPNSRLHIIKVSVIKPTFCMLDTKKYRQLFNMNIFLI